MTTEANKENKEPAEESSLPSFPSVQSELFSAAPDDANVQWLEKFLRDGRCWFTAADIALTFHPRPVPPRFDRSLRAWAAASAWIISGQKGYKHLEHATPEEIAHCANWLESQAKKMSDRAGALRRNAHRRIG